MEPGTEKENNALLTKVLYCKHDASLGYLEC